MDFENSENLNKKMDILVPSNDNEELPAANDNRAEKSPKVSEGALIRSAQKSWEEIPDPKKLSK